MTTTHDHKALLAMCDGILSDPVLFHEQSREVASALKDRLEAETQASALQGDPAHHAQDNGLATSGGTGVGPWSLPSVGTTSSRAITREQILATFIHLSVEDDSEEWEGPNHKVVGKEKAADAIIVLLSGAAS